MKTKLFSFHVFIDYLNRLKEIAIQERRSIASVINQAIKEYLDRQ